MSQNRVYFIRDKNADILGVVIDNESSSTKKVLEKVMESIGVKCTVRLHQVGYAVASEPGRTSTIYSAVALPEKILRLVSLTTYGNLAALELEGARITLPAEEGWRVMGALNMRIAVAT